MNKIANLIIGIICFTSSSCVQKAYDQEVQIVVDVSQKSNVNSVGIRGNDEPLNWKNNLEMEVLIPDSLYWINVSFYTGYKFTDLKFVVNDTFELIGQPNRRVYFDDDYKTIYRANFNQ